MAGTVKEEAQKLRQNLDKVYAAGVEDGKQSEYNRFWNEFQLSGNRTNYSHAFYSPASMVNNNPVWNDETFTPAFPIVINDAKGAEKMLVHSDVTSINVPIRVMSATPGPSAFYKNPKLHTISSLYVTEKATFTDWFNFDTALTNLTMDKDSCIAESISFINCPLSVESMESIIYRLHDFRSDGSGEEWTRTIKFSEECWAKLNATVTEDDFYGLNYREHVEIDRGWNT